MLNWMRKLAPVIMVFVIVAFVATIFISGRMGSDAMKQANKTIGKIGDEKISIQEFSSEFQNQQNQQGNTKLSDEDQRTLPLQVWESIVSSEITSNVVGEMGLQATVNETYTYLLNNPPPAFAQNQYFFTDGKFDIAKYEKFLNNPQSFDIPGVVNMELYTRNVIVPIAKLQALLNAGKIPSRSEIEEEFHAVNDKAVFEYLMVSPTTLFEKVSVTDDQVKNYYESNKADYDSDKKVSLNYVFLSKAPTSKDELVIKSDLIKIKERIEAGEALFIDEAEMESDDEGSAKNGGDLGWFKKGAMVPAFEKTAFALDSGAISAPFKSRFGYHILMVEGKKVENGEVVEVKARHILKNITPAMSTLDSLDDLIGNLKDLAEDKGLEEASKELAVSFMSTPLFAKGEEITGVSYFSGIGRFAFEAEVKIGDISDPFDNDKGYYLVSLKEKFNGGTLPLESVSAEITTLLKDSLMVEYGKKYLSDIKSKINDSTLLSDLAKDDALLTGGITDTVSRKQFITGVGYNNSVAAAAFTISENSVSEPIVADNGVYIVKTIYKNIVASVPTEGEEVKRVSRSLKNGVIRSAYMEWYSAYKAQIGVSENVREFYY
jgi:peptidyl-prolyl cis-trans isomerase D